MSFYITFVARTSENLVVSLDIQSENITKPLTSASGDVRLLSRLKSLENYLLLDSEYMSTKEDARSDAIADFVALFEEHPIYDQIRFLDPTGQEIIRINRGDQGSPIVVPKDQLQNKDDRYYFQQSIGLPSGEIYISPLDLNVEHNEIEVPYKPVIRYATPVVYNGVTYGVVVTNVLADFFLEPLDSNVMLIDTDGYYLHHPDPEKRWGRDLNTGITFVQDFPDLIATMTSNTEGVLTSNGTIFAYQPITLPGENAPRWWIINFVNIEESISNVRQAMQISLLVLGIAFLIAISATTFLAGNIVRPLQLLTDAALRVSVGDLNVDLDIHSSDEIGILATAFNNMTAQIKNLISELEQQIRALKMSTEVSRRLSTILERDRLLSAVVDQLQSAFGYYHVHIYLFDDTRQNLVMTSGAGEPGRIMWERGHTIPLGKGLVGRAAATNQGILASDTSQEPDWLPNELLPETRAEAALPIAIGNTVLGVLDVQENTVGGLTEDDQELLQAIASQVAIAVQNAQSYEQARRQAEHESRITTISQRIRAATTIDEVLQITITELGQIFGAQQAAAELQIDKKNGVDTRPRRNE
jgi:putative methionine-R-sulfoxide reductase with GAF domain